MYHLPDGTEKGNFLAVDLGGTNCRICLIDLLGDSTYKVVQTKHTVPEHLRINPKYRPLFGFIAEAVSIFLDQHQIRPKSDHAAAGHIKLGFTFSFTCEQTSISQGTLIQWDKGWDIPEALGKDPCAMLQESIKEMKLPVQVAALANDSVGALLSRAYTSQECGSTLASVIIGTGTNAAYVERFANVKKLSGISQQPMAESIIMNTEWGCFDGELEALPTTSYDRDLDVSSTNPGNQQLEKRVSGMYLGELMRLVILHCQNQSLFNMTLDEGSPCFLRYGLDSSFLSMLATYGNGDSIKVANDIERVLKARELTAEDAGVMQQLANAIVKRSARLAGSALAAIVIQSGRLCNSEKRTVQVTSAQTRPEGREMSSDRSWCCGLFTSIARRLRRSAAIPNTPNIASESTLYDGENDGIIDIGVDGSLIELYPGFEAYLRSALRDVLEIGPSGEERIKMGFARDGSGVGAALMANAATLG